MKSRYLQKFASFGENENLRLSWLLIRRRDTREILDSWEVSSPKGAIRRAIAVSAAQYPVGIRKDYVCLPADESPPSTL